MNSSMLNLAQNDSKAQNDKSVEQLKSEFDYFALFLDPENQIYYRKIFGREDFIRIESIISDEENLDDVYPDSRHTSSLSTP